ncbi:NADH dehydrogenase [ubiquinone] 1 alpha subcomplex assembly factor 4 [Lepeophtheirus salmonis]|uniref:NADH dehydrogenase [ubiquinone] 1 alpha subcomplex assembly factor 4 n=1 Tax=Lepeophtheirus salmonis TaxID=72036 RepID=UPI001AE896CE|nr:NADH dehydrogenase [ubiquinone] 1 alpha subcomplex assembly factor 4-like [Lepeophtheirus salmonis]
MGGVASRVKGHIWTRNVQRFNIESRTHKLLDKEKPTPAPKYSVDTQYLKDLRKSEPHISKELGSIDFELSQRLKEVYVTSKDPHPDAYTLDRHVKEQNPNRPLPARVPLNFHPSKPTKNAPKEIQDGRLTLREISDLLMDYKSHSSIQELKEKYNTDRDIRNLVHYYKIFEKYSKQDEVPKEPQDPLLPGPDWETKKDP